MLTELYRVSPTYPLQTYLFGNWTAEKGLSVSTVGFYKRRNNLQGLVMKTGTAQVIHCYVIKVYNVSSTMGMIINKKPEYK